MLDDELNVEELKFEDYLYVMMDETSWVDQYVMYEMASYLNV